MSKSLSRIHFLIVILIGFVDNLGIGIVYPIFAVLLFDNTHPILPHDSSPEFRGAMLGVLIGLTPLTQFFCSPLLGSYSDSKGRKKSLILGIGCGCLGYITAVVGLYLNSLYLLFLYRILVGASDATNAVAQATIADISTEKNKAKRFAFFSSACGFGFTIGPFLGGIIADPSLIYWFNYSTPLIAAGVMSLINLFLVFWLFPETLKNKIVSKFNLTEGLQNLGKVFLSKHLKSLFFAGFAFSFGWSFFIEFVPVLLFERFQFKLSQIGEYYAVSGGSYALGALIATRFIHKFSPEKVTILSLQIAALCMLGFTLVTHSYYIWWIVPVLMGSLSFAFPSATTIISNRTSSESQGEVLGVYQAIGAAACGISPLLVGSAIGALPALTAIGGAVCLLLASLGFWLGQSKPHTEPVH